MRTRVRNWVKVDRKEWQERLALVQAMGWCAGIFLWIPGLVLWLYILSQQM